MRQRKTLDHVDHSQRWQREQRKPDHKPCFGRQMRQEQMQQGDPTDGDQQACKERGKMREAVEACHQRGLPTHGIIWHETLRRHGQA